MKIKESCSSNEGWQDRVKAIRHYRIFIINALLTVYLFKNSIALSSNKARMRISLLILALPLFISAQAQTGFSSGGINDMQPGAFNHYHHLNDSSALQKKWSVSAWGGIGAGQTFFNGASTVFFPAAAGLQVNRRLNNNLYAFAGVETAPAFFYFNRSFSAADQRKNFMSMPGLNANGLGIYTGVQAGLMWVNDEKTFSISGSIGVGQSYYPNYRNYPAITNTQKQPGFTGVRQ